MATPDGPRAAIPTRYSDLRHLADGGMASVWEATDTLLDRRVAVKVLAPAFASDPAGRRRFTREARNAARLSTHPGIVTVYDAGEEAGQAYMVMALYPGGTVADRLKAGPVARPQALAWLDDVAAALDAAHEEGIVHRDVKPANLLLDAGDRVAVADFGIATAIWDTATMTQTGIVLGTLAYLAPEQRTGGAATPASDRYALGLVARELLTGARPGQEPSHLVPLPPAANAVLAHATAEDPARRPPSCVALVEELEAALGAGPTATTRAVPAAAPRPRARAVAAPAVEADHTTAQPLVRAPRDPVPVREPVAGSAAPPARSRRGALLAALGVLALLLAGGAIALLAGGGDEPERTASTSKKTTTEKRTTSSSTSTEEAATPPPASTASTPQESTGSASTPTEPPAAASTKSREQLIAQNNVGYQKLESDPAGQVGLLQESVDGLCATKQDLACAFALFNLGTALAKSGRPAEAVPLFQRRLAISSNQRGTVQQALDAALAASGQGAAAPAPEGNGKGKGKGGQD